MKRFKVTASARDVRAKRKVIATELTRGNAVTASLRIYDYSVELDAITNYLPDRGEGETMASQIATAVNKLIYKWYNDGDVYDNTKYMEGWANDLSSYANWLYTYVPATKRVLEDIFICRTEDQYENILIKLVQAVADGEDLENWANQPTKGSVYECRGPFKFIFRDDEDDEYDEW